MEKRGSIKTLKQLQESYNEIFRKGPFRGSEEFYQWIFQILAPEKRKRLMDIACGGGYFLKEAEKGGVETFGIDLSPVALDIARTSSPRSKLACSAGESLPFQDEFFDYLINLGGLEHFLDPAKGIQEMVRVLKKGGKALLLLPNSYFLLAVWNVFKKGSTGRETVQELDRTATQAEWRALIEENGLQVEKILKYNYKSKSASLKYKILRPFIPLNISYCFIFICRKPK